MAWALLWFGLVWMLSQLHSLMLVLCPVLVGWLWLCVPIQASERTSHIPRCGGWPAGRRVRRTGWPLAAHVMGFPSTKIFSPHLPSACLARCLPASSPSLTSDFLYTVCFRCLRCVKSHGCLWIWTELLPNGMSYKYNAGFDFKSAAELRGEVLTVEQKTAVWVFNTEQEWEINHQEEKRGMDGCRKGKRLWVKTADTVKGIFCVF